MVSYIPPVTRYIMHKLDDGDQSPHAQLSPFYRLSTQNVVHVKLEPRLSPSIFHTVSDKNLRRGKAGYEARKRPFHSSYDSREDSHWGRDTRSLGTSARIMLSAYLLFPHYAQCLPIILALCSMLSGTYYSQNYASIIRPTLPGPWVRSVLGTSRGSRYNTY